MVEAIPMTETPAELIARVRELAGKATPGPWYLGPARGYGDVIYSDAFPKDSIGSCNILATAHFPPLYAAHGLSAEAFAISDANTAFIASARSDVPQLCDLLERALAECAEWKQRAEKAAHDTTAFARELRDAQRRAEIADMNAYDEGRARAAAERELEDQRWRAENL